MSVNHPLKLRPFGSSVGVIIPKEILGELNVAEGDTVYLTRSPEGYRIVAHNPNFPKIMEAYSRVARKYRNALRELSK
ncbi:MAG TPA: AbrB/MazE/SpoVT family DNA-binding domain-containing protein, partial [Opitutaceae bacterium]|nr:AbrB/MazE/SpoVT family DNA-binding domain-containing protein [Opitutaceae bacterium]